MVTHIQTEFHRTQTMSNVQKCFVEIEHMIIKTYAHRTSMRLHPDAENEENRKNQHNNQTGHTIGKEPHRAILLTRLKRTVGTPAAKSVE